MDRDICSLFLTALLTMILVHIADSVNNTPEKSVFIFSPYKKIEEVKKYKFLPNAYVFELLPADMMKVCVNIAKSTYFNVNGYKLIQGASPDRLRNYRITYSRFGKRELVTAFRCPMDPPVYVQHRGKMIMVHLKRPKNFECSDSDAKERSVRGNSWFRNFFRRIKRFFGAKPKHTTSGADDFLCLGKGLGIVQSMSFVEDEKIERSDDHQHYEDHFIQHTLQPWILSRVQSGGNIFYGINSINDLIDAIRAASRFRAHHNRPEDRKKIYHASLKQETDFGSDATAQRGSENDVHTHSNPKIGFSGNIQQELCTPTNMCQSKISPARVDDWNEETHYQSHFLPDDVSSRMGYQNNIQSGDLVGSKINLNKSDLKPYITSASDGTSKTNIDLEEDHLEVQVQPKLDTTSRIHSEESDFGSISSLPLAQL